MAGKVVPLHVATSLTELNARVDTKLIEGASPRALCKTADKILLKAKDEVLSGDQEQGYILYMRFVDLVKAVMGSKEYKKDKKEFDRLLPSRKIKEALSNAEELSEQLKQRYAELAKANSADDQVVPSEQPLPIEEDHPPEWCTPTELYELLLSSPGSVLVLDIRLRSSYTTSHPDNKKLPQWLCIPQEIVLKGLTESNVSSFMGSAGKTVWKNRDAKTHVIIVDESSTPENTGKPINNLKESLSQFTSVRPSVLSGGYSLWYLSYPVTCIGKPKLATRSADKPEPKPAQEELSYPTMVDDTKDEELSGEPSSVSIDMESGSQQGPAHHEQATVNHHRDPVSYQQQPGPVNPMPGSVNHQPGSVNHQPGSVNPQPGFVNHQPGLVNPQPGFVNHQGLVNHHSGPVNQPPVNQGNIFYDHQPVINYVPLPMMPVVVPSDLPPAPAPMLLSLEGESELLAPTINEELPQPMEIIEDPPVNNEGFGIVSDQAVPPSYLPPPMVLDRVLNGPIPNPPSYEQSHGLVPVPPTPDPIPPPRSVQFQNPQLQNHAQMNQQIQGPQIPNASVQNQMGPHIQHPGPHIHNPGPQIQNMGPQIQNPGPQIQNMGPQIQNPRPQVQNMGPPVQNHGPQVQNMGQPIQHAGPQVQSAGHQFQNQGIPFQNQGAPFQSQGAPFQSQGAQVSYQGQPTMIPNQGAPFLSNGPQIPHSQPPQSMIPALNPQIDPKDARIKELEEMLARSEKTAQETNMAREQDKKQQEAELAQLRDQHSLEKLRQEQEIQVARQRLEEEHKRSLALYDARERALAEQQESVNSDIRQLASLKQQVESEQAQMAQAKQLQMREQLEQRRREEQKRIFSLQNNLPTGWEKRLDRTTGRFYYINHDTKTTHWNPPTNWINYQRAQAEENQRRQLREAGRQPGTQPEQPINPIQPVQPSQPVQPVPGQTGQTGQSGPANVAQNNKPTPTSSESPAAGRGDKPQPVGGTPQPSNNPPSVDRSGKPNQPTVPDRSSKPQPAPVLSRAKEMQKQQNLQAVFGTNRFVLTGLRNLGNTCYMNSTLQCLAATAPVIKYFITDSYAGHINFANPLGTRGQVAMEFAWLMKAMWSGSYKSVSPRDFKEMVGCFVPEMRGSQQQDSQELLAFVLDGLHEDLNRVKKKVFIAEPEDSSNEQKTAELAWKNHIRRNDSIIVHNFQGMFRSSVKCLSCGRSSVTFEPFMYLSLPIPSGQGSYSIEDCIRLFIKAETVEWSCSSCKVEGKAVKKMDIWRLPPVLLVHLKRFSYQGAWKEKRQNNINYPTESALEMNKFVAGPNQYKNFSLYAVSNHFGTLTGGHYTACCRNPYNKQFYNFDDHEVMEALPRHVKSSAAYILYYSAIDLSPGK